MPIYTITDPESGRTVHVSGPTTPSQSDAHQIFKQITPQSIIGAPLGALSAGMAHLATHPADLRGAAGAIRHEGGEIARGKPTGLLSSSLTKLNVPHGGLPDLAMDMMGDPMNLLAAGQSAPESMARGLLEHTPAAFVETRRLYTKIVEDVLSRMTRPVTGSEVLHLIDQAGIDAEAASTGFKAWVKAQSGKLMTRAKIVSRLMQEPEFRQILREHLPAHVRPLTIAGDVKEKVAPVNEAGVARAHPMWAALLPIVSAIGGLAPEWQKSGGGALPTLGARLSDGAELATNVKPLLPDADDEK